MADQITETGASKETFENKNTIKTEASKISNLEKGELRFKLSALRVNENIPEGAKILDVGCWDGALGVLIADERKGDLIQADWFDARTYKVGELKTFPKSEPGASAPDFTGINADRILLVDVTPHVGYGNGWNQETNTPNIDGKAQDWMKFINGVATGLNENGKILILDTRSEDVEMIRVLKERINQDPQLKDKVKTL